MLSYQHVYHAGNHADVLKHAVLAQAIGALQRKDTPIRVFDAHAGAGRYDLASTQARKTGEAADGILRLLAAPEPPAALSRYLATVRGINDGAEPRQYPGSPHLAAALLRAHDHLVLFERHPQALVELRAGLRGRRHVHIHASDSYTQLPGLLPPPERRGLILIDPAYELRDEYRQATRLLAAAYRRWPTGVYLLWYPLIRRTDVAPFPTLVAGTGIRRIWRGELEVLGREHPGLRGSGVLVVNLPWGLEPVLNELLAWLAPVLAPQRGRWLAEWLVPE